VEGRIAFQRCLEDPVGCPKAKDCTVSKVLARAQNQMKEVFGTTTLADLIAPRSEGSAPSQSPTTSPAGDSFSVSIHD